MQLCEEELKTVELYPDAGWTLETVWKVNIIDGRKD